MTVKVKDLKIGEVVELGKYSRNYHYYDNDAQPIRWFKMNDSCEFITVRCETNFQFDGRERYPGNGRGTSDWEHSNIRQYLNSSGEEWFTPAHQYDAADLSYKQRRGFLYDFEQYEIAALVAGPTGDIIALPNRDIFSEPVFAKRKQPKRPMGRFSCTLYDGFMLIDGNEWVNAAGRVDHATPCIAKPVRPTCYIDPEAEIDEATRRLIKPAGFVETPLLSIESLFELFGL